MGMGYRVAFMEPRVLNCLCYAYKTNLTVGGLKSRSHQIALFEPCNHVRVDICVCLVIKSALEIPIGYPKICYQTEIFGSVSPSNGFNDIITSGMVFGKSCYIKYANCMRNYIDSNSMTDIFITNLAFHTSIQSISHLVYCVLPTLPLLFLHFLELI